MTQTPQERRLRRVASAYNRDTERLGRLAADNMVSWVDLYNIEMGSGVCTYCGIDLEVGQGTFDHAYPLDKGGANTWQNLFRCCYTCQREKGTKTGEEFLAYRALVVQCAVCGTTFKPRWNEWQAGRGRLCSRRCAAKWRWMK